MTKKKRRGGGGEGGVEKRETFPYRFHRLVNSWWWIWLVRRASRGQAREGGGGVGRRVRGE